MGKLADRDHEFHFCVGMVKMYVLLLKSPCGGRAGNVWGNGR